MRALLTAEPAMAPEQAQMLSPLQLAYVGDSVHALLVRTGLAGKKGERAGHFSAVLL